MLSRSLEETLRRAMSKASEKKHEFATLEHLLLSLIEDQDALEVFKACGVNLNELEKDLTKYIDNELKAIISSSDEVDTQPTSGFQRVVQRAVIHTQSSGRSEATGANVVVAMFSERDCYAVYVLQKQDMKRLDAVSFISHGLAKDPNYSKSKLDEGIEENENQKLVKTQFGGLARRRECVFFGISAQSHAQSIGQIGNCVNFGVKVGIVMENVSLWPRVDPH